MEKALNVIKLCLMASVTVMCLAVGVKVWNVGTEMEVTLNRLQVSIGRVDTLTAQYATELGSDKNRKAIEAGIAAAASWQATARLVNTTTIPALNRALGELENSGRQLAVLVEEQNDNLTGTNDKVGRAIDEVNSQFGVIGGAIGQIGTAGEKLGNQIDAIGADTHALLGTVTSVSERAREAMERFDGAARNIETVSGHLAEIGDNLREASESAPGIAKGIEKVASKAPWYQKMAAYGGLLVGIGSLVWR